MSQIPPDHNALILGLNIGLTGLALLTVLLRLYTRAHIVRLLGLDDLFATLAVTFAIIMASLQCAAVHYGMGQHIGDVQARSEKNEETIEFLHWLTNVLYPSSLCFSKLSILFILLRLSPTARFRSTVNGFIVLVGALTISHTVTMLLLCVPTKTIWSREVQPIHCINRMPFYITMGALNIGTDVALVGLPLPVLLRVQLPMLQKGVLLLLFSAGAVGCVASGARLTTLRAVTRSEDPPWAMAPYSAWTAVEAALAVICACVPTLRPLMPGRVGTSTAAVSGGHLEPRGMPFSGRGPREVYAMTGCEGGGSEERIVGMREDDGRIMKTTNITVRVDDKL
ncbi:hypothetical protein EDC01DRAFT_682529 [Geopyxis carbonaria]|nr:hypothetical protein EDC01DRAFT_682529 [Geopyxis carbonaria]